MRDFKKIFFKLIRALALICLVGCILFFVRTLPYFFCFIREPSWRLVKTEAELDQRMSLFYSKRVISPSESMWGKVYVLKPGERMIQYLVLYLEPYDVVFNSESRIVVAFASYD